MRYLVFSLNEKDKGSDPKHMNSVDHDVYFKMLEWIGEDREKRRDTYWKDD